MLRARASFLWVLPLPVPSKYLNSIHEKNNCRSGLRQLSSRNQLIKIISYTKPSLEYIGIIGILLGAGENILELIQPCLLVLIYHILIILDDVDSGLVLQALRCRHIITDGTAMQLLGNQSLSFLAVDILPMAKARGFWDNNEPCLP